MKITTKRCTLCEAYHAEKDGKEFQVEVRLEDGTANDPKKCTVIIDGEEATVDVKSGEDALKKAVKSGAEKLGFKIVERYCGDPTVADVKRYLQRTLDELGSYEDGARVLMLPNTYGIGDNYIVLGDHGYMPMTGFDVDDEADGEDESKKHVSAKEALQKKLDEARRKAAENKASEAAGAPLYAYIGLSGGYGYGDDEDSDRKVELQGKTYKDFILNYFDAEEEDLEDHEKAALAACKGDADFGKLFGDICSDQEQFLFALRRGDDCTWSNPEAKDELANRDWTGPDRKWLVNHI